MKEEITSNPHENLKHEKYKDDPGWSLENEKTFKALIKEITSGEPSDFADINSNYLDLINKIEEDITNSEKLPPGVPMTDNSRLLREVLYSFYNFHDAERIKKQTSNIEAY